jgi:hypothetical protein
MWRRKLLALGLLFVVLIAWMVQGKPEPSKVPQLSLPSESERKANEISEVNSVLPSEEGGFFRTEIPVRVDETNRTTVTLVSSVGAKIEKVVLHTVDGERKFLVLPQPGEIERALVPDGTIITPSGHLPQRLEPFSNELVFLPYALLRIRGCPPQIKVSDVTCHYIHDGEVGSFFVWAGRVKDELVVVAMPPSELKDVANVASLPLRLRLAGGYSLDVDFSKSPGVVGECSWGAILSANPTGPPMTVRAIGEGLRNVRWKKFVRLPESVQLRSTVAQGPWGVVKISTASAMETIASGKEALITDVPFGAEVLFFAHADGELVGWSTVFKNNGQEIEVLLRDPMSVDLRLRDSQVLEKISGKPYFIKIWFTYQKDEFRSGKQRAVQEFRGSIESDGTVQLLPKFSPHALFSWLRPNVVTHGLPDELRVQVHIPGYSKVELTEELNGLGNIDLGIIDLERGGESIVLELEEGIPPTFLAGSHGLGVDLESGQQFSIRSTPGFAVEFVEALSPSSFRLWLSGKGASAEGSSYLILDTEQHSTGFTRSAISNKYLPLTDLDYQVEIGPETRASFEGSRIALAFGNSALISFPFNETIERGSPCTLDFRAPARSQFLVFLPLSKSGLAQCFALSPGVTSLP